MTETNNNNDGIIVGEISKVVNINPRINRILSMLLDHFIMTFIIVPPLIILMILKANGI